MVVEANPARLRYLLDLYRLSDVQLLDLVSENLTKKLTPDDIFSSVVDVNHLKRVDKIFNRGLSFYTDPADPPPPKQSSIFFRKEKFTDPLNFTAKKVIEDFEEFKLSFLATAKTVKIDLARTLATVSLNTNPKKAADRFNMLVKSIWSPDQKTYLTNLINSFAKYNILVLEYIEHPNLKEPANVDGAFLSPNIIVVKRQAGRNYRREIFTLIHEFGHYLLNEEEAESIDDEVFARKSLSKIEMWCNDFAFYFLITDFYTEFINLSEANQDNDYHHSLIEYISSKTHISQLALYTRLLMQKKISKRAYSNIKREALVIYNRQVEEEKLKREEEKQKNPDKKGFGIGKPINSELLLKTVQAAFQEGVISEYDMIKSMKHRIR